VASGRYERTFEDLRRRYDEPEWRRYLAMHERRYEALLNEVRAAVADLPRPRILDVGAAYEAEAIRLLLPGATVDTLGFADERVTPREHERHVELDLNDAEFPERRPQLGEYDVAVVAEVLEHLHASPLHGLRLLASALRPGGTLIVQTPNAASLTNRLALLRGRNPFEQIRESRSDPGHFREYTVDELLALGAAAGLEPGRWFTANYFRTGSRRNRAFVAAARIVPRRLRAGITLVLRKPQG
jgi:2-polyprenyl-3-methyl-5-hydroxy-6-metoxy-1,4-benzoquinol methylase